MAELDEDKTSFWPGVDDYIQFAESLKTKCSKYNGVHGIGKLERKIGAELKFLHSLKKQHMTIQSSHLQSSNLCHFASVVHTLERVPGVVSVLQPFNSPTRSSGLVVDVLGGNGHLWVKVIARKAQALHLIWAGQGQFGERDLLNQAQEYATCTKANLHDFSPPIMYFAFYNGVTRPMAEALWRLGIHVLGSVVAVDESVQDKLSSVLLDDEDDTTDEGCDEEDESCDDDHFPKGIDGSLVLKQSARDVVGIVKTLESSDSCSHKHVTACVDSFMSSQQPANVTVETLHNVREETLSLSRRFQSLSVHSSHSHDHDKSAHFASSEHCSHSCISEKNLNADQHNDEFASACGITLPDKAVGDTSGERTSSNYDISTITETSTSVPVQESLTESSRSQREKTPASSTHPIKLRQQHDPPWMSFDALFQRIVLSPPVFHTDGIILLNSFASGLDLPDASGDGMVSRDVSLSSAPSAPPPLTRANLDITTLITLVSSVTHGRCHYIFNTNVLTMQAEEERLTPVLPALKKFLEGKQLLACRTAVSGFQAILDTLGGPGERDRAAQLLDTVLVVPDQPSARALALDNQGKIKQRSKIIFGTGDQLRAVTVTSNSGFVRAARHQGVVFSVHYHQARALTEQKEALATPL